MNLNTICSDLAFRSTAYARIMCAAGHSTDTRNRCAAQVASFANRIIALRTNEAREQGCGS